MPNGEKSDRYNIESSILTNLFNIGSNLAIPLLQKKWLEHWTFELKADLLPVFLSKIENGSEITLPLKINAIQLNSGRFRAILRYSSGFSNNASYLLSTWSSIIIL